MICAACGEANREVARFCDGCGERLSPPRCAACDNELRPGARFCDGCGAAVGEAPVEAAPKVEGARKVVTLVFADLAGSTSLQERMDAESVRRVMDRFYDVMRGAVTGHGGTVVKFMGDGLMAAFGVPTVAEDDAVRAVRAAAAMQEAFVALADEVAREWDAEVGLRVGVNTGEVVVAEGEDDVVGDAVNVAARLEHAAGESQVLVGQETWRLTRDLFTFEEVPALELKGKAEAVPGYRLVSLTPPAAEGLSPFVGRDPELARLTAAFEAAVEERRAHLVTVVGSPGLGKSRLVRELARRVGARARMFEGQCETTGASTFAPVADVLRQAAGIEETASADEAAEALAALFPDDDGDSGRITAAATTALGVGGAASPEETFWAVRRIVEQVAARQPAIVVFDDVHWAEPMLLDLLDHLAEWTRDAPVLLVALARPEIRDVRPALADAAGTPTDVLVLDALPDEEGIRLASELLEGHPVDDDVAARLLASAEGNPLFLRELVKMLLEDGVLHLEDGVWVTAEGADVDVPPTIHALLSARIERLEADERSVVERASVVGHQFFRGAVAVLSPPAVAARIDSHLETLRRKEVVEPEGTYWIDEPVFRFHHALIRDAAYRRLLKEARAELHEQVAEWLAAKAGDLVGEHEEVVGYHLEQAFGYRRDLGEAGGAQELGRRAAGHLAAAARRSLDRDDLRAAAGLMGRAVACLPPDDTSRAELLVDRCEALLGLGEVAAGKEALAELEAASGGSPRLAAWAEAFAAEVASFSEPEALPDWDGRAAAAADRLQELGDPVGAAKAAAVHASILARLGQVGACEAALDRALAAAREAGDRRRANGVLAGAPMAALWGPSPVTRAAGRCLDVVRVLRITTDSPPVEAVALRAQGVLEAFRGRFDAARRLVGASRRTLEELGLRHGILQTDFFAGLVELAAADAAAAETHLRTAYEGFRALGVGVDTAQAAALLARACLAQGRDGEALELTQESERLGGHDLKTAIAWRAVRAEALARRGQGDEALRLARDAVGIAAETDALVDHADARLALATVLAAGGDGGGASAEARRAAELYEAKGATALAERAQRLAGGSPTHHAPAARIDERERAEAGLADLDRQERGRSGESTLANTVTAVWDRYRTLFPDHDVDGILATVAPDYHLDERQLHAQHATIGRDGFRDVLTELFQGDFRSVDTEVLAIRGDHLALVRVVWHIRARSGGEAEVVHLRVDQADAEGMLTSSVVFDAGDLEAAYDELEERYLARVEPECRPVFEASRATRQAYNARDWRAWRAQYADDFALIDHRPAGWEECDVDRLLERILGIVDLAPDFMCHPVDLVRLAPRCLLASLRFAGTDAEGGVFEISFDLIGVFADGRFQRNEWFDPSDRTAALARFDELVADQPAGAGHANLALAAWRKGVEGMHSGDVAAILATAAEGYVYEERGRPPAKFALAGREQVGEMLTLMLARGDWAVDTEVVATRGARLALTHNTFYWVDPSGAATEYRSLRVDETDEAGMLTTTSVFDPNDLDAAMDELDERYLGHVDPSCAPIVEVASANQRATNARDWERMLSTVTDDFKLVDHRLAGFGERDAKQWIEGIQAMFEMAPDVTAITAAVVRVAPNAILSRTKTSGSDRQGGRFEQVIDSLGILREGRLCSIELFDPAQEARALARFDEVAAEALGELGSDNLAVTAWRRFAPLVEAKDFDAMASHYAPEYVVEGRIRSSLTRHEGRDAVLEIIEVIFGATERLDYEPLATRGRRLALGRVLEHLEDKLGGDAEHEWLQVDETDEAGLMVRSVSFDPDDLDAAMDELDERYLTYVDPACLPLLQVVTTNRRTYNARDWEAFRATLADDLVLEDHRPGWFGELGRDAYVERIRALVELSADARMVIAEIFRVAPHAIAGQFNIRGSDPEGGTFEIVIDVVSSLADGRFRRIEFFDPARRSESMARFEELAGRRDEPALMNSAVRQTLVANERLAARELDGVFQLYADDVVTEERRHSSHEVSDGQALREWIGWAFENVHFTAIEFEPVAIRGDTLALGRQTFWATDEMGGQHELNWLQLVELDEDGLTSRFVLFELDDLDAAFDELDARYRARVGPECGPYLDLVERLDVSHRNWDVAAYRSLLADDFVAVDHRLAGWGELGPDDYCTHLAGLFELTDEVTSRQVEQEVTPTGGFGRTSVVASGLEGGPVEITFFAVGFTENGRFSRMELFPLEARAAARARFEELVAASGDAGSGNLALQAWEEAKVSLLTGAVDPILARVADDASYEERRATPGRFTLAGRSALAEMLTTMARNPPGSIDTEVVAMRGGRLVLTQNVFHGTDHRVAGDYESTMLRLDEVDDAGRFAATVLFEPEDIAAAFDELDERFRASLAEEHRAVFDRIVAARRAYNAHDWEAVRSLLTDDFALLDHRPGWFGTLDRNGYLERLEGLVAVAPDASIAVADIPRLSADTAMIRWTTRGTGPEGGPVEIMFDSVAAWSGDRVRRFEFFPVEERDAALKRFEELAGEDLTGAPASPGGLVSAPNRALRVMEQIHDRIVAGDFAGMVAHHAPDIVLEERRRTSHEVYGSEELRSWGAWAGEGGVRYTDVALEPLAVRGERLTLGVQTYRGENETGGEVEISWLLLCELDEESSVSRFVMFEPDDVTTAIEMLDQRFEGHLTPEISGAFEILARLMQAYKARDWAAFRALHADDFVLLDHRPAGWGECDLDAYVERLRSLLDLASDMVLWVAEVPRISATGAAMRTVARGTGPEGGPVEIVVDHVLKLVDGRIRHQEYFPPERRDDALERFDEMARLQDAGDAVRTWARVVDALHENDVDSIVGLVGPEYRDHDHVLDVVTDREEQIRNQNVVAAAKGLSIEWDRVLDLPLVAVVHARYRWSAGGGSGAWGGAGPGEFEGVMVVALDDGGRIAETHRFGRDHLHRALALAEERHVRIASGPDEAAVGRRFARMWNLVDAYNRGDWDGVREMWADGLVTVDHRPAGWGTVEGRDRYVEVLEGLAEVTRDRRWIVHDLLYRGHRALAARWSVTGTDQEGGPFEMLLLVAFAFDDDGRVMRQEIFPEDGSDEALAAARGLEAGDR